jgi:hypothetical protein
MAIRLPLMGVLDYNDAANVGAGSVAGGVAKTFFLPQDTDNVVVKLTASIVAGGVSAAFQTTDDGGTTWFDVARTSIVSNTAGNANAQWLSIPVCGTGVRTTTVGGVVPSVGGQAAASIYSATGSAAASSLGQLEVSGLPILGPLNRVFLQYTAAVSANALSRVQVKANSQSATA